MPTINQLVKYKGKKKGRKSDKEIRKLLKKNKHQIDAEAIAGLFDADAAGEMRPFGAGQYGDLFVASQTGANSTIYKVSSGNLAVLDTFTVPGNAEGLQYAEDGNLLVERPLSLTVQDGDLVELLIDLNTATWLAALDPDLRTVAETIVANAISIVIR